MKIGVIGLESFSNGKENLVDARLETLKQMFNSAKKVYLQVEIITDTDKLKEADGIIASEKARLDIIVGDIEFVETRLERSQIDAEKKMLLRFKEKLEKEEMLTGMPLSEEEQKLVSAYPLLSIKPVVIVKDEDAADKAKVIFSAYYALGYISYFTAGDKDSHGWSIKKGMNAWEASGAIHSDIQKGFIRAEVLGYQDLIDAGNFNQARSNNKVRLENKEYIVQDGDLMTFRFNK
ncbi:MAG: DUF933 domain-containing protein [Candidatus Omnitrophica bacterium]|nr:DUF933 domain-containing protein [Candidatus Omnitrophota bacterium]